MSTFTCAVGFFVLTCQAPQPAPPPAARFCEITKPVQYSASDTAETRRQLRALNAKYRAVCGG